MTQQTEQRLSFKSAGAVRKRPEPHIARLADEAREYQRIQDAVSAALNEGAAR